MHVRMIMCGRTLHYICGMQAGGGLHRMSIHMSVQMSVHMSAHMSVHMSAHMFVHMSKHTSMHMSIHAQCNASVVCSLAVVCISQFAGIILAAKLGSDDPNSQKAMVYNGLI